MLLPTDDSLSPFCFLTWAGRQGEFFGTRRTVMEHVFSRLGTAWSWEGRSTTKSPNSSVTPCCAHLDLLFFPWWWHLTATKAPADFRINQMIMVVLIDDDGHIYPQCHLICKWLMDLDKFFLQTWIERIQHSLLNWHKFLKLVRITCFVNPIKNGYENNML